MSSEKVAEYTSDSILIDFQPHSDTDCLVCPKKTVKLKSFSFIRINNPSSQQKIGTKLIKQKLKNLE